MKLLSPTRMAQYDSYAIQTWGIPSSVLMENAGRTTYRLIQEQYLAKGHRMLIVCGRGNNGGDGFVIARYAVRDGYETVVTLLGRTKDLKGDAAINMRLYLSMGGKLHECPVNIHKLKDELARSDIIVDAIFGTGLSKPVTGVEKKAIDEINKSRKPVMAVDIPSGLDGEKGVPLGTAINATHTFTFAYPKTGHILYPGAFHTGRLTVVDISLPSMAEAKLGWDAQVIDGNLLRTFLKTRTPWSHKGTYGHAAVIAGSPGKTGAAYMASMAALTIGAGLVTLLIPARLNDIMEVKLTEVMTYPVKDRGTGFFLLSSYNEIMDVLQDKDIIIMGPGLSQNPETMELVRKLYTTISKPCVIDADGINAFQGHTSIIKKTRGDAVFTPHPGELSRITGISPQEINADRIGVGKRFTAHHGVTLVLKGARTIVCDPRGDIYINPTGNQSLAKGGSGDILTGLIGGLLSQGYSPVEASLLGTYIHGYIADSWLERFTDMDLLACDMLNYVGETVKAIKDGTDRVYIETTL